MDSNQLSVLRNIMYAVETGGQVYGNARYDDFTEAYTNSSIEYAITIGAGAWYATEALKLLRNIYAKDSSLFTESLLYDMNNKNWSNYAISRDSENARTIVRIISSEVGKKCQDALIDEQLVAYCNQASQLGVTEPDAQAMVANWQHQGGLGAVKRILAKTAKPYTLDNLYAACCTDTEPNQVGSYRQRQRLVYQWLKQYMPTITTTTAQSQTTYEINPGTTAEDILNIMRGWIGLNQFDGSHMQIVNIYNNHRPLARSYALNSADSWCAATVSSCFIKANAVDLIGGTECGVDRFIEDCFKPKGIWIEDGTITPQPGDIICFNWDQSYQPNNGFADHIGIVEYVEGGVIHTIEGNAGGRVQRRTYPIGDGNIRGFARPKYGSNSSTVKNEEVIVIEEPSHTQNTSTSTNTASTSNNFTIPLKKGNTGNAVRNMQLMLIHLGYDCAGFGPDGDFGNGTESSLKLFQKQHSLQETGVYNLDDKIQLEKSYANSKATDVFPMEMFTIKTPNSYLRSGASKNKPIVAALPVGKKVTALKQKLNGAGNKWIKVKYQAVTGWIVATSLRE